MNIVSFTGNGKVLQVFLRKAESNNQVAMWRWFYKNGTIVEEPMSTDIFKEVITGIPYGYVPKVNAHFDNDKSMVQIFLQGEKRPVWARVFGCPYDYTDNSIIGATGEHKD